jgi:hypothetical protein
MVGRWGLAKPWIFGEFARRADGEPDVEGRLAVLRRYVELCREHFRDDEKGRGRTRRFVIFHQDFFRRFRRGAGADAVNADDPRNWGAEPEGELESWLCRADVAAGEALCDWLVDGGPCRPPAAPDPAAPRAVTIAAHG